MGVGFSDGADVGKGTGTGVGYFDASAVFSQAISSSINLIKLAFTRTKSGELGFRMSSFVLRAGASTSARVTEVLSMATETRGDGGGDGATDGGSDGATSVRV